jgi:hemerythrin-like domain-containing protein
VLGDVLTFLDTAVPMHSADEEQTLFPRLREALGARAGSTPMDCMEREHVEHQALLAGLKRAVVRRDPRATAAAALAIVAGYREHIGKEEEVLFPWARETLTNPALVDAMTQQMRARRVAAGMLSC